ncbi:MAG: hypothetical protein K2I72_00020, partial [Bacilli bacterium]|nr:hypothetical protein [Bacilli bacterium]
DIEYSNVSYGNFILHQKNGQKLVHPYRNIYDPLHRHSLSTSTYSNIKNLSIGYELTLKNGKKKYGAFDWDSKVDWSFNITEKEYDSLEKDKWNSYILGVTQLEDGSKVKDIIRESGAKVIQENVIDYLNQGPSLNKECTLSDGTLIVFDEYFNKLLQAKDVVAHRYLPGISSFDVLHKDGKHSLLASMWSKRDTLEKFKSIFGTYDEVEYFYNGNSSTLLLKEKTENNQWNIKEYAFFEGDYVGRFTEFSKIFEGTVVDVHVLEKEGRTILTVFDSNKEKNVVGVIENKVGNICIPFEFDKIDIGSSDDTIRFIAENENGINCFDSDGYFVESEGDDPKTNAPEKKIGTAN